jgi:hypothetical protein
MRADGRGLLQAAVETPAPAGPLTRVQDEARALLQREQIPLATAGDHHFNWYDEWSVRRVNAVIDRELRPGLELYRSPLRAVDAFALLGVLSGSVLTLLALVFAPLAVGTQQAQEVHENTLQPLTGTALRPRELVLGLVSGPLAVIAVLAAPQVLLLLVGTAVAGRLPEVAGLLAVLVVAGAALCLLAQLSGHVLGRQRTPGIVGGLLLAVFGTLLAIGCAAGLNLDDDVATLLTGFPQASAFYLLHEAFGREALLDAAARGTAASAIAVSVLGSAIAGFLLLSVLERKVAGREGPALASAEALVGAVTATWMVLVAVPGWDDPWRSDVDELYYVLTLGLLAPVLGLLVMSRVPVGDVPPALRRVPLRRLAGELAVVLGIHLGAVLCVASDPIGLGIFHPVALFYLAWSAAVLGLLAVRLVAFPVGVVSGVWVAFCGLCLLVAFGHAAAWSAEPEDLDLAHVFALSELSPLLGVLQAALTVWIPVSLVRTLRRNLGGLS